MKSFRQIIDLFGVERLSRLLGVPDSHIRTMRARDSIPAEYWGALVEAAPSMMAEELTYSALRQLRTERFGSSREDEEAA